jgi:nucleotide-binding universal stress UspA family protein
MAEPQCNHPNVMTTAHPALRQAAHMFENVVVGVRDYEAGRDALALARELGSPVAALTLVHVHVIASKPASDSGAFGDAAKRRIALRRLTALADELGVDGQVACVEARSARRGLHQFASDRDADVLVVSASHRDELGRDFIGDDAKAVLEDAPCTVAVAPAGYSARAAEIRRIGVAYDGSPESEQALALGRRLAARRGADLSAFQAVGATMNIRDPWNLRGEFDEPVEEARQRIAAVGGPETEIRFGDAIEELTAYGQSVDLLVIGSHKYRPMDRLLEQTTSQQLADRPSSPLLVLASTGRSSPSARRTSTDAS